MRFSQECLESGVTDLTGEMFVLDITPHDISVSKPGAVPQHYYGDFVRDCGSISPTETLYHRDDALLYIAYVMLIWAAPIPADRWHCSLWPYLTPWIDWHAP